ncbi:MAG: T9SS type A sorting domain-containing protein [Candidatus Cloacimonadaceae bacterium]|nr:T9SS type A sorting domain-containing protein [Candidatus Cloacimonadota bacterium]MDD5624493.1 T9SS type A sorting domain-containing protein [Candidatus Cloacimonadota bacterium]
MKQLKTSLLAVFICLFLTSLYGTEIYVVNSVSRTLSRLDTETGIVNNTFAHLGLTPNLMDMDENNIYIVCSGDNAIQVISRSTGTHLYFLPVASSSNPYDVLKVGDFLYVTGLFTNKLYKISLLTHNVVSSLSVGEAPEGLCSDGSRLYVCNTGGYINNYANSSISVIDLDSFSVIETIPVWTNPQFACIYGNYLHIACTGNWNNISGKIDIINLEDFSLTQRLDLGGHPGNIWINNLGIAYVGEGMSNALYSYNADTFEIYHSYQNPMNYSAFMVDGNQDIIALLNQTWTSNSIISVYDYDFNLLNTFSVGISSTDLRVAPSVTYIEDEYIMESKLRIYPNPYFPGNELHFSGKIKDFSQLYLYNIRGQMVFKTTITETVPTILPQELVPGLYLYKIIQGTKQETGKLFIKN